MTEKINKESIDILEENISKLKKIFPNVFSEAKINFKKLKETLGEFVDSVEENYSFSWAGRSDSIKNIQSSSKGTLIPDKTESINFDESENIFIEGENLEILKLLQKPYNEKIKMIYIDPPYNTGHDFIYKDDFKNSIKSYLEQTGQTQEGVKLTSNPETSGRFHSDWISFMYPRLFLARNLLHDEGVLVVSIDDNESSNLRLILNEIFGEENFVIDISWQKRYTRSNNTLEFTTVIEHLLFYSKSEKFEVNLLERTDEADSRYTNPDKDPKGPWKGASFLNPASPQERPNLCYPITNPNTKKKTNPTTNAWRRSFEEFQRLQSEGKLYWGKDGKTSIPAIKMYLSEARNITPINFWDHKYAGNTDDGTKELNELLGKNIFDNPKPTQLIKRVIEHTCRDNDIILDFFSGSSTSAHAILENNIQNNTNNQFVLIQLPELCDEKSIAYDNGYKTIADIGKERIRRVIKKINEEQKQQKLGTKSTQDLGFKVFKLIKSNYKIWEDVKDETKLKEQLKLFENPLIENYKDIDVIYEIILKEGYSLNSKIEEFTNKPNKIYKITDGDFFFYVTLDQKLDTKSIEKLNLNENTMFACLDSAIDDSQKTNLNQRCKLKTI